IHPPAGARHKPDRHTRADNGNDRGQRHCARRHFFSPAVSTRYAIARQTLVNTIQPTSQARLKGSPRIRGSTRSHSETEKHIAANGIAPSNSARTEGGRTECIREFADYTLAFWRPRRMTMSYSGFVTGWTERRLPFCVTIIFSRPRVDLSVSSEMISGKRSANAMSTMYQAGASARL